ncbi:hypothetical protein KCM76_14470 [Zooshikella marina]|uniref:hypothetical protein n=1 Tax=Zooshikella ganghwensis TaxID=202772 RepID=UPI001BAEF63F|nr:hypothetical protein [Zooshikella ganghwensis]MBU2707198.1 hypothetical protein [Zooshikella ganghwensis]
MKKLVFLFIFLFGVCSISPLFLYWYGLSYINEEFEPSNIRLSPELEQKIWGKEREVGKPRVKPVTPYGYIAFIYCNVNADLNSPECLKKYPGLRTSALAIKSQVAQQVRGEGNIVWHLSWISSSIWVTRNWDIHQILATYNKSST